MRLLGGCSIFSYKVHASLNVVVKGKVETQNNLEHIQNLPRPSIMEQKSQFLALTITLDEVNDLYVDFHTKGVICIFNSF